MEKSNKIRIVLPFEYTLGEMGKYNTKRKLESVYDCAVEALAEIADGIEMPEVEQDIKFDLSNIDWAMLRKQKEDLFFIVMNDGTNVQINQERAMIIESLEGIISLIDDIQDHAVDVIGLSEKKVFNLSDDE
jgi:hypothetical protein